MRTCRKLTSPSPDERSIYEIWIIYHLLALATSQGSLIVLPATNLKDSERVIKLGSGRLRCACGVTESRQRKRGKIQFRQYFTVSQMKKKNKVLKVDWATTLDIGRFCFVLEHTLWAELWFEHSMRICTHFVCSPNSSAVCSPVIAWWSRE